MIHLWEADILEVLPQPRLQLHFLITYSQVVVRTALDTQAGQREREQRRKQETRQEETDGIRKKKTLMKFCLLCIFVFYVPSVLFP